MSAFRFSPRPNRAGEIQWRSWGPVSFSEARQKNRPVLLSISAVWCHWCHVMDETTYSDDGVIARINEDYIPVRVDRDRRPDVDARYNMGGWPTTAFLTPAGRVITGGTYTAPEQMTSLLRRVTGTYRDRAQEMARGDALFEESPPGPPSKPVFPPTDGETLSGNIPSNLRGALKNTSQKIASVLTEFYDADFGGFASPPHYAPKFPFPQALDLLCSEAERGDLEGGKRLMLEKTLDGMLAGEIFDSSDGGFFRCAAGRDWGTPHYEKLAAANAGLIEIYLRAGRTLEVNRWFEAARQTLAYLKQHLTRTDGGFSGSQDADEDYYRSPPRAGGEAPLTDQTLYTDVNARTASAHILAYRILGNQAHLRAGLRALQVVEDHCTNGDNLYHYCDAGNERASGLLADYTELALANLDAHTAAGDPKYLDRALSLAEVIRERFALPDGSFSDREQDAGDEVALLRRPHVCVEENARTALLCHKISLVRNDPSWEQQGVAALLATAPTAEASGPAGAIWAAAHLEISEPAPHVRVLLCSRKRDGNLLRSVNEAPERHAVIEIDEGGVQEALVYVCRKNHCFPPTSDPEELKRLLAPHRAEVQASRH